MKERFNIAFLLCKRIMCLFKKKKPVAIDSKYRLDEFVLFKDHKNEATHGTIYNVKLMDDGQIMYDIQVGGECPAIIKDIPENKVIKKL